MLKFLSFQKLKYFLLVFLVLSILFTLFLLFNNRFFLAQDYVPLDGNLVSSGRWEPGRIPMALSSENVLTAFPFYVSRENMCLNTTSPVSTLRVNGTISANELCIRGVCHSSWPSEAITGSGSPGQITFWTGTNNLSGSNNLLWDNNNSILRVNGNVVANNFIGTINASNVSAGTFGANSEGGNYSFLGNVGIGTTAPGGKLGILSGWGNWIIFYDSINGNQYMFHNPSDGSRFEIGVYDASVTTTRWGVFTIRPSGNVGIGTTNPTQKLDVRGYIRASDGICIGNDCRNSWPVVVAGGGGGELEDREL